MTTPSNGIPATTPATVPASTSQKLEVDKAMLDGPTPK